MTTTTTQLFSTRADAFDRILTDAVGRWDAPTPCADWTARDVVGHVIGTEREFLERHDLLTSPEPSLADPAAAWRAHAAETLTALAGDGVAEREYDGYFGPTTLGATVAEFYGWDLVIHGWDVARATGQDWSISDDEARALGAEADGWGDALYSAGVCGPAVSVPADAPLQDRLLGRLGRDPAWTPPS